MPKLLIVVMAALANALPAQRDALLLTDRAWNSRGPAWNAAGTLLAYESNARGNWDIYTLRPDGSGLSTITSDAGDERYPG